MKTVRDWMRVRKTSGDVGIEIEMEGNNLPRVEEHWHMTHDGSLRPGDGEAFEYVFKRPMSLSKAKEALDYLGTRLKDEKARVLDTGRCGVHVHVNCQDLNIVQLYNFMTLYLVLEEMLVKFCGKTREGNLFCLRAKDAEYLIFTLEQALEDKEFRRRFATDDLRYASMNVKALPSYGSLEFRAMRGTDDMELVHQWASILVNLREVAKEFPDPREIVMQMSAGGGEAFMRNTLGEHADLFLGMEGWESMLMGGARLAQDVAFAGDWEALAQFPKRMIGGIEVPQNWDEDFPPMDL